MADKYTVWVGGVEINDNLMPKEEAVKLANSYRKQGYRDVHIEKYYVFHSQLKNGKSLLTKLKKTTKQ